MLKKQGSVFKFLVTLTLLFVLWQLTFLWINLIAQKGNLLLVNIHPSQFSFSKKFIFNIIRFIAAESLLYALFIYFLWFIVTSIEEFIAPRRINTTLLAFMLWSISIITLFTANACYVPQSYFSQLITQKILKNRFSYVDLEHMVIISLGLLAFFSGIALVNLGKVIYKHQLKQRHYTALTLVIFIFAIMAIPSAHTSSEKLPPSLATESKPNIFIIGFDAVRPDFLGDHNKHGATTPNINMFLKSSVVFTDTYTPLGRTFPSWVSMLTGKHPLYTHAREDMFNIDSIKADNSLPKLLQAAGYETMYASDDNRFNNVNNEIFGFEHLIGPPGDASDFILSSISDFPISNLITPTRFGKLLFPYNFANHAASHTYNPDNFLNQINKSLQQRSNKPLFFAAHFNVTGWPFYWFNDHLVNGEVALLRYKNTLNRGDKILGDFISILEQKKLLTHAIFILVSDHGITLNMPNDRIVKESLYQGNKNNIHLMRYPYNIVLDFTGDKTLIDDIESKVIRGGKISNQNDLIRMQMKLISPANRDLYGIDTSYGYGSDVLSLKQYRPLLAIRMFGIKSDKPHLVTGRSLLLDITPTILDFLHLHENQKIDGVSLVPYLTNARLNLPMQRPIFLESNFTLKEIENDEIAPMNVLQQSINYFEINPKNDLVSMTASAEKIINENKQRAILQGDWLLAYYATSLRYKVVVGKNIAPQLIEYKLPPYFVLVNLKTGKWTLERNHPFNLASPFNQLNQQLNQFYGKEMNNYNSVGA